MDKLDSALCQWNVLYTHYFNFQFSYLHAFYKQNNIKSKPQTKINFYFQIYKETETDRETGKYSIFGST